MSLPGRFVGSMLVALAIVSAVVRWVLAKLSPESARALEEAADPFAGPVDVAIFVGLLVVLSALIWVAMRYNPGAAGGRR